MGGPAGVADAAKSRDGAAAVGLFQKGLEPAFGLDDVDFRVGGAIFPDGDAGGVIAPVFPLFEPPQQDVNCTPFVRQYDILNNKWGALLCRKEYQTNAIHQNSRSR